MKVTILGCGASMGVPTLKFGFGNCNPNEVKNFRTRSSIFIQQSGINILIDASPDVRMQMLRLNIESIDGVILTHVHFDHTGGINDLRPFWYNSNNKLQIYTTQKVEAIMRQCYFYLVGQDYPFDESHLEFNRVQDDFLIKTVPVSCFEMDHGFLKTLGIKIEDFAYTTDMEYLSDEQLVLLKGVETWVIACSSIEKKKTHANLDQVLEWISIIKPKRAFLTHMDTSMDYNTLCSMLPANIRPAYDGLEINM